MIRVGVCGLGMMGMTHLDIWDGLDDVEVVAVADADPRRLEGREKAAGNIEGQAKGGFDLARVERHADAAELIARTDLDVVDICLPTTLHRRFVQEAVTAGRHVLVEKPLCRTAAEARQLATFLEGRDEIVMPAMCMRFWPGWDWLKEAVAEGRFGAVLGATFRRVVSHPGGKFYLDGEQCGGALLDLHVHDTDFVAYCFGRPEAVTATGYSSITGAIDHVMTQYHYSDIPLVAAEGGWAMAEGFAFSMRYDVNFERATASYDLDRKEPLLLFEKGRAPRALTLPAGMGYEREIAYFLACVRGGTPADRVSIASAVAALEVVEAERRSIETGERVVLG